MSLYKRGEIWWSRIVRNGEVFSRSTKRRNRNDAIRVEAQWLVTAEDGNAALRRSEKLILSKFENRFFDYIATNVKASKTRSYYKTHWIPLRESRLGEMWMQNIQSSDIETWIQNRSEFVSPSSVNGSLRTLRRALRLAQEWNLIKTLPKIRLVIGEHSREYIISDNVLRVMLKHEKCTAILRDLLPFLFDTGLRLSEAIELTWAAVNLDKQTVFIAKGKSKSARRTVPLTTRAVEVLNRRLPKDEQPTARVFDISAFTISHHFKILRDALKQPKDCVLHSFRHTYLTRLGKTGATAFEIMRLAGHSSVTISQRYVHEDTETLRGAVERLQRVELEKK